MTKDHETPPLGVCREEVSTGHTGNRKNWENYTFCSLAYNMDEYPCLKKIKSQISEQTNISLRKLSVVLAYYGWENYLRVIEIFLVTKDLKNKY